MAPVLLNSLLSEAKPQKLAFYSSPDSMSNTLTYLHDVAADGTGFIDVFVSQAEFVQVHSYTVQDGPSVRFWNALLP